MTYVDDQFHRKQARMNPRHVRGASPVTPSRHQVITTDTTNAERIEAWRRKAVAS